jgi:hypothetical protein
LTIEIIRKRDRISGNNTVRLSVCGLIANGLRVAIIPTDNRIGIFNHQFKLKTKQNRNQTSLLSDIIVAAELFVRSASEINVTYSASEDKTLTDNV